MTYSGRLSRTSSIYRKSLELETLEPDPPFWTKTSWLQLGYGIWVNLTLMNIGLCLEFSAVVIPQLKDDESDITMTKEEEAMIASVLSLSCPIGCILAGIVIDRCGRKAGLIWCHIPIAIGWFYVALAKYASGIIFGRIISGIGIGMAMAAPRAYIAEITLPNMRGVIGALPNLTISIGLTIQAVLGTFFDWRLLCYLCGGYAIMLLSVNCFLPDTPYFILLKSTASAAKMTLKRFRSSKFNIDSELKTLEEFKTVNRIRRLSLCETIRALFNSSSCKPFCIILFYITLAQLSGVNVITAWAVEMLQLTKTSIDPHWGNVGLAGTRIVVGVCTSFLMYRVGRRPLALMSALGVGGVSITLGGYLYTEEGGKTPLVLMVAYVAFAVPGYYTLPTLMMFELFPLQVRGILSGAIFSTANVLMFGAVHTYPTLRDSIGLANTFVSYGVISLLGAIVLFIILPETKELTLQEIEEYYNHRRSTLVSERRLLSMQLQSQMFSSIRSSKDVGSDRYLKDPSKIKKKKCLRIVSSENISLKNKVKSRSSSIDKNTSSDDMIIVYDEDELDNKKEIETTGQNQKKIKKIDSEREKKDRTNRGKQSKIGQKESEDTSSENKIKTIETKQYKKSREEIKQTNDSIKEDKENKPEPRDTETDSEAREVENIKQDLMKKGNVGNKKDDSEKPGTGT